MPENVVEN